MLRGIERAAAVAALRRGFAYQPALDGVRAVAVVMVLLFHHGWLRGGYVGVSVFFTLSGFLITSLALAEHDGAGRLDVRAFYGRRVRRLLPASLACLGGIVVLGWWGLFDEAGDLRRDVWGALAQVYNWVALSSGQSYADLVGSGSATPSPVEHYWSLAIEEQFYWVWPLVLVGVLRRGRRRLVIIVAALTAAGTIAAPVIAGLWGPDAVYWATPARFGEILVGALVAVALHARRRDVPLPAATAWFGVGGLGIVGWAAVTWPNGSGPAYEGWLPVFAWASAAVVVGVQVTSPLRRVLAMGPLVALGAISYGVYLYHWPIYVVLDADRTGLGPVPLFALRIAVTLGVSILSFRLLEQPIRGARTGSLPRSAVAIAACAAIAVGIVVVPADSTPYWASGDDRATAATLAPVASVAPLLVIEPAPTAPPPTVATTTPRPVARSAPAATLRATTVPTTAVPPTVSRPVRIMVVGDSTAQATGAGMLTWAAGHADVASVAVEAEPGCGFIRDGIVPTDQDDGFRTRCRRLHDDRLPAALASLQPDIVVGMVTMRDIEDRQWDAAEGPLGPADDRFIDRLVADYDAATQRFLASGATDVVWILAPVPDVMYVGEAAEVMDPDRYRRYAAAVAEVAARHPGRVTVVDLASWFEQQPTSPDRPDGVHWSLEASTAVAAEFLGPLVVAAAVP